MTTLRPLANARLILASASPRRHMLLAQIGVAAVVDPSRIEEEMNQPLPPGALVETLSRDKATDVAGRHADADLVLGADTVVVHEGRVLGKPTDEADARRMLRMLSGHWHQVYTGFTLVAPQLARTLSGHAVSDVRFRSLDEREIDAYIATGEPLDKAGAYGIQERGGLFVAEIRGDYSNIVGLPIPSVDAAWRDLGFTVL